MGKHQGQAPADEGAELLGRDRRRIGRQGEEVHPPGMAPEPRAGAAEVDQAPWTSAAVGRARSTTLPPGVFYDLPYGASRGRDRCAIDITDLVTDANAIVRAPLSVTQNARTLMNAMFLPRRSSVLTSSISAPPGAESVSVKLAEWVAALSWSSRAVTTAKNAV